MDVAKSEVDLYKSQYETALNQLRDAKDNLEKVLETRTHRKRYQVNKSKGRIPGTCTEKGMQIIITQ